MYAKNVYKGRLRSTYYRTKTHCLGIIDAVTAAHFAATPNDDAVVMSRMSYLSMSDSLRSDGDRSRDDVLSGPVPRRADAVSADYVPKTCRWLLYRDPYAFELRRQFVGELHLKLQLEGTGTSTTKLAAYENAQLQCAIKESLLFAFVSEDAKAAANCFEIGDIVPREKRSARQDPCICLCSPLRSRSTAIPRRRV